MAPPIGVFLFVASAPGATLSLAPLIVTCSHLLLPLWGLFCSLCRGPSPSGPLFRLVFGRAFLALCVVVVVLVSLFAVAPVGLFWSVGVLPAFFAVVFFLPLCASFCVVGCPPVFLCLWVVLSFAGFSVLWCGGSPPSFVPPSPLSVVPLRRPGPVLCWSLPLGIWLLHATARLPCFNAWGVVVLCFLASFCSMAAKAIWPCVGICVPSTPWRICCCGALCSYTEVFIFG